MKDCLAAPESVICLKNVIGVLVCCARSLAFTVGFPPCPMHTGISPDFLKVLIFLDYG